ncbi:MAG: hypothetical protein AB7G06_04350 [Bdellovibrionales bacterium]
MLFMLQGFNLLGDLAPVKHSEEGMGLCDEHGRDYDYYTVVTQSPSPWAVRMAEKLTGMSLSSRDFSKRIVKEITFGRIVGELTDPNGIGEYDMRRNSLRADIVSNLNRFGEDNSQDGKPFRHALASLLLGLGEPQRKFREVMPTTLV